MTFVTVNQLRAALRSLRLERGWSYDQLATDIRRTNGDDRVSEATIRRFILAEHHPRETIEYALRSYLDRTKAA